MPNGVWPFASSTPITRSGTPFTLMKAPIGVCDSPNSLVRTVCPMTATCAARASSSAVMSRPISTRQFVIGG